VDFSDPSCWVQQTPAATLDSTRAHSAEQAVHQVGIYSPWARYETVPLSGGLVQVRGLNPGERFPAGGSSSWIVAPDDRVYEARAWPGTTLDAAEDVLSARYAEPAPVDDDEAARLQTAIDAVARARAI
jgi:hypothetical protein